jgi:hypothetical protein
MVEGLQDCFPARFKGVHFINQPWYVDPIIAILKAFLKEKTRKKVKAKLSLFFTNVLKY